MSSHLLAPIVALVRRIRASSNGSQIERAPTPSFDGMQVPPHLIGKSFDIRDADGNLVAVVNKRRADPRIVGMIG